MVKLDKDIFKQTLPYEVSKIIVSFNVTNSYGRVIFFCFALNEEKTSWWEETISSPSEADGVAGRETRVFIAHGPIPFGKTLQGVEKPLVSATILSQPSTLEPPKGITSRYGQVMQRMNLL